MTTDGRVNAWVVAWQCLNEAVKVRNRLLSDNKLSPEDQERLRTAHAQMIAESTVAAALAGTHDYPIGLAVGAWLEQQYAAEAENEKFVRSAMDEIFKGRDSDSPRDVCAECGIKLDSMTRRSRPDPTTQDGVAFVCPRHYDEGEHAND